LGLGGLRVAGDLSTLIWQLIEQVALLTGRKDWKMSRRHTYLRPETLHDIAAKRVA